MLVVAGVGILGGQKRVVEVEFAHGDAVGPGRPLRRVAAADTEDGGAAPGPMCQGLLAGNGDRPAQHRRGSHCGVVDDPVEHHRLGLRVDGDRVRGHLGDLVSEVLGARELVGAAPGADRMNQHSPHTMQSRR